MLKKIATPFLALAMCSLFLLGCSEEKGTEQEPVELEITQPLEQLPEGEMKPAEEVELETLETEAATGQEPDETVPGMTSETTETEPEEGRPASRPRRALEGC
jgi:phage tail tube protein FII